MKVHWFPFSLTGSKVLCRWQIRLGFPLIGRKKLSLPLFRMSLDTLAPAFRFCEIIIIIAIIAAANAVGTVCEENDKGLISIRRLSEHMS